MAALLAATLLLTTAAPVVQAAGFCSLANHGYYQIYVSRTAGSVGASYFDRIQGEAHVRDLNICVGSDPGQGGSFVLPANVQGTSGIIYQLGYGKFAGDPNLKWVYADGDSVMHYVAGFTPAIGVEYRFQIQKVSGLIRFTITDIDSDVVVAQFTKGSWSTSVNLAWWGYETWDSFSAHGRMAGEPFIDVTHMGYSHNENSTLYYRTGITSSVVYNTSGQSNHHGHIRNRYYTGDTLDAETH